MQQLLMGVSILLFGLFIGGVGLASAGVGIGIPMIPIGIYVTCRGWRICNHKAKTRKQQEKTELVRFEKTKLGKFGLGAILILIGIGTSSFGIGIVIFLTGIWLFYSCYKTDS